METTEIFIHMYVFIDWGYNYVGKNGYKYFEGTNWDTMCDYEYIMQWSLIQTSL